MAAAGRDRTTSERSRSAWPADRSARGSVHRSTSEGDAALPPSMRLDTRCARRRRVRRTFAFAWSQERRSCLDATARCARHGRSAGLALIVQLSSQGCVRRAALECRFRGGAGVFVLGFYSSAGAVAPGAGTKRSHLSESERRSPTPPSLRAAQQSPSDVTPPGPSAIEIASARNASPSPPSSRSMNTWTLIRFPVPSATRKVPISRNSPTVAMPAA